VVALSATTLGTIDAAEWAPSTASIASISAFPRHVRYSSIATELLTSLDVRNVPIADIGTPVRSLGYSGDFAFGLRIVLLQIGFEHIQPGAKSFEVPLGVLDGQTLCNVVLDHALLRVDVHFELFYFGDQLRFDLFHNEQPLGPMSVPAPGRLSDPSASFDMQPTRDAMFLRARYFLARLVTKPSRDAR